MNALRAEHRALADALVLLTTEDPGALPALYGHALVGDGREYAYAVAQRLVAWSGLRLPPSTSGRGRVTSQRFDQRLKHNRDARTVPEKRQPPSRSHGSPSDDRPLDDAAQMMGTRRSSR